MLFKDGRGYNLGTKLTGFITSLGEKNPLNSAVWGNRDDLKFAWAYVTQTAVTVSTNSSEGVLLAPRIAEGRTRVSFSSSFDNVVTFVAFPLCTSGAVASRLYTTTESWTTTSVDVYLFEADGSAVDGSFFCFAVGDDAATTNITDNSSTTPLSANSLNRVLAVGNYKNPSIISDTCWVLTAGWTKTTVNPGDTLSYNVCNYASQTRSAAGNYTSTFTANYIYPPLCIVTPKITTCAYALGKTGVSSLSVRTTNGVNATLADTNYGFICLGEMEVA